MNLGGIIRTTPGTVKRHHRGNRLNLTRTKVFRLTQSNLPLRPAHHRAERVGLLLLRPLNVTGNSFCRAVSPTLPHVFTINWRMRIPLGLTNNHRVTQVRRPVREILRRTRTRPVRILGGRRVINNNRRPGPNLIVRKVNLLVRQQHSHERKIPGNGDTPELAGPP